MDDYLVSVRHRCLLRPPVCQTTQHSICTGGRLSKWVKQLSTRSLYKTHVKYASNSQDLCVMLRYTVKLEPLEAALSETIIPPGCSRPVCRHRGLSVSSEYESISVMLTLLFSAQGWRTSRCLCFHLARSFIPFIPAAIKGRLFGWQTPKPSPGRELFVFLADYLKIGLKVDLSISAARGTAHSTGVRLGWTSFCIF